MLYPLTLFPFPFPFPLPLRFRFRLLPLSYLLLVLLLLHAPTPLLAISLLCSGDYGYPTLPDCRAAHNRMPFSGTPVFFGPSDSRAGTITCPFSIPSGTCTIRIQCSHRAEVTWARMHTLTTILIEGDGVSRPGCVKDLGKGGVAALFGATDPLWIEIAQTGVQGPGGSGSTAPLLKGVTADQLAAAGLEPLKPESKPVLRYWTDGGVVDKSRGGVGSTM